MENNIYIEKATGLNAYEQDSIYRSVKSIVQTPIGTCPFKRAMGLKTVTPRDNSPVEANKYASDVMSQIDNWDERILCTEVTYKDEKARIVVNVRS